MENNQPENLSPEDKELAEIQSKTPGFEQPEVKEEEKPEEIKPEETPTDKIEDKAELDKKETEEVKPEKFTRPHKYIPLGQYTDEKKTWRDEKKALEDKIASLTNGSKTESDDAIKKYAEKYGLDIEDAREEIQRARDALSFDKGEDSKESKPSLTEEQNQLLKEAEVLKAEKLFQTEFQNVAIPEIKNLFPNATAEQIKAAQAEVEALACTKEYLTKDLDYIVFKNKTKLAEFFTVDTPRKGLESHHASNKGKVTLTADDFKDGKTSFDELKNVTESELNQIVNDMDIRTYEKWNRHINSQQGSLTINRSGKKMIL